MNAACNNINDLNQNDLEQFEGAICNVVNGINNTYDRKNLEDGSLHYLQLLQLLWTQKRQML